MHTCIHNCSLQPFSVRIIDLDSHTNFIVCVNFVHKWRDSYSWPQTTDFFEKLFMPILFTLRVFARNLLRGNRQRNTFRILFLMSGHCLILQANLIHSPLHYVAREIRTCNWLCCRHFVGLKLRSLYIHMCSLEPVSPPWLLSQLNLSYQEWCIHCNCR